MKQNDEFNNKDDRQLIETYTFNKGIPGFEHLKLFNLQQHDEVFSLFSALEESTVAFVTVNPFDFYRNYEFELSSECIEELQITDQDQVLVRCIVTLHDQIQNTTANLLAPLVFNKDQHLGKQIILTNNEYKTKHTFWSDKESQSKDGDF
ncbi:flagellar assembly protein FliW [Paenibacillus sp. FSL W7-1088]|uniref:flagellar assembly protein FliW n=1 Tax=Paenibacillus sp. FSL W7-1088 TaxID=2921695 RepID=UPI0030EED660